MEGKDYYLGTQRRTQPEQEAGVQYMRRHRVSLQESGQVDVSSSGGEAALAGSVNAGAQPLGRLIQTSQKPYEVGVIFILMSPTGKPRHGKTGLAEIGL